MARVQYDAAQIAHAVDVVRINGGNLLKSSKMLGIQRSTLREWVNGHIPKHASDTAIAQHIANDGMSAKLADKAEEAALKALEAAADRPEKIDKASFKELLVGAQSAITSAQLLRGRPTSRSESATIVYVQPTALRDMSGEVIEGTYRADSGTKALAAGADV